MTKAAKNTDQWVPLDPEWLEEMADALATTKVPSLVKYADHLYDLLTWMHADDQDEYFIQVARERAEAAPEGVTFQVDDNASVLMEDSLGGRWVMMWLWVNAGEVDFPHGCLDCELKGYLWPVASDGDESKQWIERCDACGTYEDDLAAAAAMTEEGYDVRFAMHPRGGAQPYSTGKGTNERTSKTTQK